MAATTRRPGPAKGSRKIVFTPAEVAERRARVADLASLGENDHAIGRALGVSKTTAANDRRVLGIPPQAPGRPPKSPLPEQRACDTCGKTFQPRRENVKQGGGRFCSKECMAQDPKRRGASRAFVSELNAERAERIRRLKQEGDLIARHEAAAILAVTPANIDHYVRQGYLTSVRVDQIPGQPTTLFSPSDVQRFKKEWRRTSDPKKSALRSRWFDPDWVVMLKRARGITEREARERRLTIEQMEDVFRGDVIRRAQGFTRRGRPKGSGPPAYHYEWAESADYWRKHLSLQYEEKAELGLLEPDDHPPTDWDVFLAVAESDFAEHPERHDYPHAPGDPQAIRRDFAKHAVDKVRKAIKALQIPATEIR